MMRQSAFHLLAKLVGLRPGESRRVGSMFGLLGLIIATSYILKPLRSSLFLSQFGAHQLPYVYMLVALVLGFVTAGFAWVVSRFNLKRVFIGGALLFASNLVLFWWALDAGWPYTGFVFYVWVSIFTVVMPSLFWLLAQYVFYSNEGRRLFSTVTAGGLAGSIVGGGFTSLAVDKIGTSGLLFSAVLVLFAVAALVAWIESEEKDRITERRSALRRREMRQLADKRTGGLALIARSRYLTLITLVTILISVTSTFVDYQFNAVAEQTFHTMDALTGFFGTFFASINALAFLLQLLLAGHILNRLGVGIGLLLLPLALFTSSVGFLLFASLWTASALKLSDDGLSNSLNKSSLEILYLPIPLEVKNRAKAWLDMFVERVSRGVGGLIILLSTTVVSLGVSQMSWLVLALVSPWMVLAFLLKGEYVKAFRRSLARRDIDLADLTSHVRDQQSLSVLQHVLSGSDEKQTLYALQLLRGNADENLVNPVARLASSHPSAPVRAAALKLLCSYATPPLLEDLSRLAQDDDPEVSAEALGLLVKTDRLRARSELEQLFRSGDTARIHALFNCTEESSDLLEGILSEAFVRRHYRSPDPEERELAARAIGLMSPSPVQNLLPDLLADPSPRVARAAAASVGLRDERLLPLLIDQLPRRALRVAARRALARLGPEVVDTVARLLENRDQDLSTRRALPQVLAEFNEQKAVEKLLASLPEADPELHYQSIKALGRMRARWTGLRFSAKQVDRILREEGRRYCDTARKLTSVDAAQSVNGSRALLKSALEERFELTQERIFRLLGLMYSPSDIYNAWNRIAHGRPAVRDAALEFLANLLSKKHRETILPLLEASSWREVFERGQDLGALPDTTLETTLRELLAGQDAWLAACAVTLVGEIGLPQLEDAVEKVSRHPDPLVQEAAQAVLQQRRWSPRRHPGEEPPQPRKSVS